MNPSADDVVREVHAAEERIGPYIRETPVERSPYLSRETGCEVYLKMENFQVTNSFKARGAFNALLALTPEERARGVVTSSSGNHGNACAYAMPLLGIEGEIWLPSSVSRAKLDQLEARGAKLVLVDDDPGRVETLAREEAERTGRIYLSPYNDLHVIGGQGTIARELLRQLEEPPDAVFVPVGGGGLVSGIAGYLKGTAAPTRVIGCQAANSPVMAASVAAGELLESPYESTLADAVIGWAEPGAITFPLCRDCVDAWSLAPEDRIAGAIRTVLSYHSVLVEGAGALSVASLLATMEEHRGETVVLLLSGARIPLEVLAEVVAGRDG